MKIFKLVDTPVKALSAHLLISDEFFVVSRCTDYNIFVGKGSDPTIINTEKLCDDCNIITTPVGVFNKYSLIACSPSIFVINARVKEENCNEKSLADIMNQVINILFQLGYHEVVIDKNSRGNDLLYNQKKVGGCTMEALDGGYVCFTLFLQGNIDKKLVNILDCIDYPQVKLKDKTIMERVGFLPNLEDKFDEFFELVKSSWGYSFEECSSDNLGICQELIIRSRGGE